MLAETSLEKNLALNEMRKTVLKFPLFKKEQEATL